MDILIKPSKVLLLLPLLLLPGLNSQKLEVWPKVIGYVQNDVTLHCQFIQGRKMSNVTALQWDLESTDDQPNQQILVYNRNFGLDEKETPLKARVKILEQSLIIKDLRMSDAGTYKCHVTTFPAGSFEKSIQLEVRDGMKPGLVAVIAIVVVLLFIILAATVYLFFIRRYRFPFRQRGLQRVLVTTAAPRDHDVVYADVSVKPAGPPPPISHPTTHGKDDEITYSKVALRCHRDIREEEEEEMNI